MIKEHTSLRSLPSQVIHWPKETSKTPILIVNIAMLNKDICMAKSALKTALTSLEF
jgi:hypothetical protein